MNATIWLALALVLVLEGLGPLLLSPRPAQDGSDHEPTAG